MLGALEEILIVQNVGELAPFLSVVEGGEHEEELEDLSELLNGFGFFNPSVDLDFVL